MQCVRCNCWPQQIPVAAREEDLLLVVLTSWEGVHSPWCLSVCRWAPQALLLGSWATPGRCCQGRLHLPLLLLWMPLLLVAAVL